VVQLLRSADCAYGNCELVMAAGDQGYPTAAGSSLSVVVDPKMAEELAWLGYDLMATANNHSTDYGVEGVRSSAWTALECAVLALRSAIQERIS